MSTLKRTTMHPRCWHIGACWDLLEFWFKLFSTSQNTRQIKFRTFLKKKSNFLVLMLYYSWRPFRWRINYLCRTDIDEARAIYFLGIQKLGYGQNSISSISKFMKNFHIFGFPWCNTREDHSIDVSITNVGLI